MCRAKTFPSETHTIRHIVVIPNVLGCRTINYCYYDDDDQANYVDHITASDALKTVSNYTIEYVTYIHIIVILYTLWQRIVTRRSIRGHVV